MLLWQCPEVGNAAGRAGRRAGQREKVGAASANLTRPFSAAPGLYVPTSTSVARGHRGHGRGQGEVALCSEGADSEMRSQQTHLSSEGPWPHTTLLTRTSLKTCDVFLFLIFNPSSEGQCSRAPGWKAPRPSPLVRGHVGTRRVTETRSRHRRGEGCTRQRTVGRRSRDGMGQARVSRTQSFRLRGKHFSFDNFVGSFLDQKIDSNENVHVLTRLWNDPPVIRHHRRKVFAEIKQGEVVNLLFLLL